MLRGVKPTGGSRDPAEDDLLTRGREASNLPGKVGSETLFEFAGRDAMQGGTLEVSRPLARLVNYGDVPLLEMADPLDHAEAGTDKEDGGVLEHLINRWLTEVMR